MADAIIATANTNSTPGSIVDVSVEGIVCRLSIEKNKYFDTLPIIPTAARVENEKILYRVKVKAELVQHSNGKMACGQALNIKSNRSADKIISNGRTDSEGIMFLTLETYEAGSLELSSSTPGVTSASLKIVLKDAWYESLFLITGYNVCNEIDFSGPLVEGTGLQEKHKEDFLFGARGIPMQGTGMDTNGKYISLLHMRGHWIANSRGAPDHVLSQDTAFQYVSAVKGKFGLVKENHSIAVDPHVIPPRAQVDIDGVGLRFADDKGSKIVSYHIDNFLGSGKAVVQVWLSEGVNGTHRRVKFLGD
ncbi:3D domain-containing protein [Rugamonas rivuli]|nr:3D domain-containing protein [Rugamonas rivuli]